MPDPLERFRPTSETLHRSLLDRLVDLDPDWSEDRPKSVGTQMDEIRESFRRDLESLLNTRRPPDSPPDALPELNDALVSFGVDGFYITALVTAQQREEFAQRLENRIRLFEPRFESVRVSVLPARNAAERSLRLRIEAAYVAAEGFPPVAFETAVDPSTQRILVEAPHGG
ncbi:MAG: type VI secretion system baseplate subunit TssE [Mesorhizobium amorphae]|nr:MAG: type VI secretion system baseplate subunit TssE [Mesorhizobium amorphae]